MGGVLLCEGALIDWLGEDFYLICLAFSVLAGWFSSPGILAMRFDECIRGCFALLGSFVLFWRRGWAGLGGMDMDMDAVWV